MSKITPCPSFDTEGERSQRVMQAMLNMEKPEIDALERAAADA